MIDEPIIGSDESELLATLQGEAVCGNPTREAKARSHIAVLPAFTKWIREEHARGTEVEHILAALPNLVTSLAFTGVRHFTNESNAVVEMTDLLLRDTERMWKHSRKATLKR